MKKIFNPKVFLILLIFLSFSIEAQTIEQVRDIVKDYDMFYLKQKTVSVFQKKEKEKQQAVDFAIEHNLPLVYSTKDGGFASLQRIFLGKLPIYYRTHNSDAAKSTRTDHLNSGGSTGFGLNGENMTAHVWDSGHALATHQEFLDESGNSKIFLGDSSASVRRHPTHVIGTIAAKGVVARAKGMAPESSIVSYDWNFDISEAYTAAMNGMLISNHSYGYDFNEIATPDWNWIFGAYTDHAQEWDELMFDAPYYLMVVSAGNDGLKTHLNSSSLSPGYDVLSGHCTAKNNLVVANAKDASVDQEGNLISVSLSPDSSPGPTDDFRIKPDIAGNGYQLYSTFETNTSAYGNLSGTSMASPNVTGSLLLLQQHYQQLHGSFMKAATLKGLALHTADDAGPIGPDAKWGWGLLNAKKAAETISNNEVNSIVREMTLNEGEVISIQVDSDEISQLQASISWTDRAGTPYYGSTPNHFYQTLVNDLDIRISQNESEYYPWRLISPTENRQDGDNSADPFERIDIENASGTYTITISHKGNLVGASQDFTLIVTGIVFSENQEFVYEDGNWTPFNPNGVSTSEDNIVIVNGTASIDVSTNVNNITINQEAVLEVKNVLNLYGSLNIEGEIVFKSSDSYRGELGYVSDSSLILGEATVENYMSANRSFRMLTSSVSTTTSIHENWQENASSNTDNPNSGFGTHITGTTIDQTNGFDATISGNPSMFTLNASIQEFEPIANTDQTNLEAGTPYLLFVRGDRSIDLGSNSSFGSTVLRTKGVLWKGDNIQNNDVVEAENFVMFGNPYQSSVDMTGVLADGQNVDPNFYYIYDPTLGNNGAYVPIILPSGENFVGSSANQYIQPGQAGQYATLHSGSTSITFKETDKAPGQITSSSIESSFDNILTIQLYSSENYSLDQKPHDGIAVIFNSNLSESNNIKKIQNFHENLGIVTNEGKYSVLFKNEAFENEIIKLTIDGYTQEDYVLKINSEGNNESFVLLDTYSGIQTLLNTENTIYPFSINLDDPLSTSENRFEIRSQSSLGMSNENMEPIRLYPNPIENDGFYIQSSSLVGKQTEIRIVDMLGREVFRNNIMPISKNERIFINKSLGIGLYVVILKNKDTTHSFHIVKTSNF